MPDLGIPVRVGVSRQLPELAVYHLPDEGRWPVEIEAGQAPEYLSKYALMDGRIIGDKTCGFERLSHKTGDAIDRGFHILKISNSRAMHGPGDP